MTVTPGIAYRRLARTPAHRAYAAAIAGLAGRRRLVPVAAAGETPAPALQPV